MCHFDMLSIMYRRNLCYTNKSIERNTTFAMWKHEEEKKKNRSLRSLAHNNIFLFVGFYH